MKWPAKPLQSDRLTMPRYRLLVVSVAGFLLASGCTDERTPAAVPAIQVNDLRDYGYVTGDLIPQTLSVTLRDGQELDTSALPSPGAVSDWLSIRDISWKSAAGGDDERLVIEITYQVFKGVREPEQLVIPPLMLKLKGNPPQEMATPEWKFTLVPVIPPDEKDESLEVREPLPAIPLATHEAKQTLLFWITGLFTVIGLYGLRHALRSRRIRPFAEAEKGIRLALTGQRGTESVQNAARLLHRAFDRTFGETLFAAQIERFCRDHPDFRSLREDIEAFYVVSERLFFAPELARADQPFPVEQLINLAKRCVAAERSAL